jgi:RNA polymerase sigma factor (sigma-70 family)
MQYSPQSPNQSADDRTTQHRHAQYHRWCHAIGQGCATSEAELCRHLHRRYTGKFVNQGFPIAEVEDAEQEAILTTLEALRNQKIKSSLAVEGYYQAIIKYRLWRQKQRAAKHDDVDEAAEKIQSEQPEAEDWLDLQKRVARVVDAIDSLKKDRDRDLLRRSFMIEQPTDVICAELSLTKDHYYRVLHRARQRLHQALGSV